MDKNKKLAAAIAAVSAYLDSEKEQLDIARTQAWNRAGRMGQIQQRKMVLQRSVMKFAAYR